MIHFHQSSLTFFSVCDIFLNIRQDFLQIRNSRSTELFHNTNFNLHYTAAHLHLSAVHLQNVDCVLYYKLTQKFKFLKPYFLPEKCYKTQIFLRLRAAYVLSHLTATMFKCSTTCMSTVTTGSARLKLYMHNQFHRNTKCIYILHAQYFELLKIHQNIITPRFLKPITQTCFFFLFTLG
jgi:hypothetical protein